LVAAQNGKYPSDPEQLCAKFFRERGKILERTDDIRETLAQEILRKEVELNELRQTLTALDTALAAAAEAHARSAAAHALSLASRLAADGQRIESTIAPVTLPPTVEAIDPIPEPATAPAALQEEIEPADASSVKVFKERRATPRAPGATRSVSAVKDTPEAAPAPQPVVAPLPGSSVVPEQIQGVRTSPPGKYTNLKVWKAVQTLLFERAEKMSLEEIARELKAGGATLGESPVRTVATAVGYMNTKIFHVTKSGGKTLVDLMAVNN
jgi:hypothetical protein